MINEEEKVEDREDLSPEQIAEIEEVKKDIGKYKSLAAVEKSEGGKELIAGLTGDILQIINTLAYGYETMPEQEMRTKLAKMSVKLALIRMITRAKSNAEAAKERLEELIKQ
jgi:hypothetical protein